MLPTLVRPPDATSIAPSATLTGAVFSSTDIHGLVDADFRVVYTNDSIAHIRRIDSLEDGTRAFPVSTISAWVNDVPSTSTILNVPLGSSSPLHLPTHLVDNNGDSSHLGTMTSDILASPALGSFTYKERLSRSPSDAAILRSRFSGLSDDGVAGALSLSYSGSAVLAPAGIKSLQTNATSLWSNPASRMKRHRHQMKDTLLSSGRLKFHPSPGDALATDTYYSGLSATTPFF